MWWYLEHLSVIYSPPPFPRLLVNLVQGKITVYDQEAVKHHKKVLDVRYKDVILKEKENMPHALVFKEKSELPCKRVDKETQYLKFTTDTEVACFGCL